MGCQKNDELIEGMVRQGDVLLVRTDATSTAPRTPPATDGTVVLAHGEVTGHRHRFDADDVVELREAPERPTRHLTVVRSRGLLHEEHSRVPTKPGTYDLPQQVEYSPGELRRVTD